MNLKELKEIINLMNENGLAEVEVENDNVKIRLKKESSGSVVPYVVSPGRAQSASAIPAHYENFPPSVTSLPSESPDEFTVRSPMVGTFYESPSPEAQPYVTVGKTISENDVLCIIEAMKLMNEIKSEVSGTVTAILVKNGQAIEYDQPLFRVRKA